MENIGKYNSIIQICWKGELKNILEVYISVSSAVPAPQYVFGLFDVYLKFYLGVIFYETEMLYLRFSDQSDELRVLRFQIRYYGIEKFENEIHLPLNIFPERFHDYIRKYNSHLISIFRYWLYGDEFYNLQDIKLTRDRIIDEFKSSGLFIYLASTKVITENNARQSLDRNKFYRPFNTNITSLYTGPDNLSGEYENIIFDDDFKFFNVLVNEILHDVNEIAKELKRISEYYGEE